MTIYGRSGDVITLKRLANVDDVLQLEGREPDQQDLAALKSLSYFVIGQDDGTEALHHVAYLRATGGAREIDAVVDDLVLAEIASAPARHPVPVVITTESWEGDECVECGDILVANEEGQPTCTCCGRPGPRRTT